MAAPTATTQATAAFLPLIPATNYGALRYNHSTSVLEYYDGDSWEVLSLDATIDARIIQWARTGNTDRIPAGKIANNIARDSEIENWAKTSNATLIPLSLIHI